jgi:hypothetical protein
MRYRHTSIRRGLILLTIQDFPKKSNIRRVEQKIHRSPITHTVTYQEQLPTGEDNYELFNIQLYGNSPYIGTLESFEWHIHTYKKQKTIFYTQAIFTEFNILKEVIKRAPTWIFDSAFDSTLNPYLHVSIYYFFGRNVLEIYITYHCIFV